MDQIEKTVEFTTPKNEIAKVKALWVTDITEKNQGYWYVPLSEQMKVLRQLGYEVNHNPKYGFNETLVVCTIDFRKGEKRNWEEFRGSASTRERDPADLARKRAVLNACYWSGEFEDMYDQLRKINGKTLAPGKGDPLVEGLAKTLGL